MKDKSVKVRRQRIERGCGPTHDEPSPAPRRFA